MSVLGMVDAMRSDLPASHRLVWMCLENHASRQRRWSISTQDLAEELHVSRDTVQSAILNLEEQDVIKVERQRRHNHVYHLVRSYGPKLVADPSEMIPDEVEAPASMPTLRLMAVVPQTPPITDQLMSEIPTPTVAMAEELMSEIPTPNDRLMSEKPTQTDMLTEDLMSGIPTQTDPLVSENPTSSPELMSEIPTVVYSTSKISTKKESTRKTRATRPRRHPIPDDWEPTEKSFRLAEELGMPATEVIAASHKMRAWVLLNDKRVTNWDLWFDWWIKGDIERRAKTRPWQPEKGAWKLEQCEEIARQQEAAKSRQRPHWEAPRARTLFEPAA